MKNFTPILTLLLLMMAGLCPTMTEAATTVGIPTASNSYISWNDCDLTGAKVENSGANIGSTGSSTVATFIVSNATQQDYILTFATGSKNAAMMQVTLTDTSNSAVVLTKNVEVVNTGSWTPTTVNSFLVSQLPVGTYELEMRVTEATSYAGNWGNLAFYVTDGYNKAPGTIAIASGNYSGARLENSNTNVGYVSNGTSATYSFICTQAGVYKMTIPMTRYGDGTITTTVTDVDTHTEEASGVWTMTNPSNYADTDIPVEGELTPGMKTMTMQFAASGSYLCNYKDITMTRIADHYAKVAGMSIEELTVTSGATSDWYCQLPVSYAANTTFSVNALYGTVVVTAKDDADNNVAVTSNGDGSYTIATPGMGKTTTVMVELTPNEGAVSNKSTYTFKLFRIGEISLTAVTVNGTAIDVLSNINNSATSYTATSSDCYTTVPTVAATQIDGAAALVNAPVVSGTTYTYTIHGAIDGTDISRDYTLVLDNVHVYSPSGSEESVNIKANEGTIESNTWTNGVYTLATTSLDSYNQFFKMNGDSYTISVPADVVVKQVIMKDCSNNYAGNNARLTEVVSTGATAYIPVDNKYYHDSEGAKHDIIVNIEDHVAGTDIVLNQPKSGQPMAWIQLTTITQNPGTVPVKTSENVTLANNHAVVAVTFDREISGNVNASVLNGSAVESTVTAEGGSSTLYFPVWNLDYSTNYYLHIDAGAVADTYGNRTTEAIDIAVNVPAKAAAIQAVYDYVVGGVAELEEAVTAVNGTNTSASAARKTIFLKNGDYDLGSKVGQGVSLLQLRGYNVSLIGESRDGVIIHGDVDGISNPVLNLRDRSGFYLQDLTVRNDRDYGNGLFNGGVAVAVYGGDKTVMKNVRMLSNQDTQVTGHRAYFENCEIHGTVDFICGGGDNYYYQTSLVLENRSGDVIAAPSTNSAHKWGYVFQQCTVSAVDGATVVADGSYNLGRPWQNEPRAAFLNTVMQVLPSNNGWTGMSTLPTHFYEYGSVDASRNAIDLSVRGNSPTSTNNYTPVLTAAEAAKYSVENVLGGTDSWLPTEQTVELSAPTATISGMTLSWTAVDEARCYVVFKDGAYYTNLTATSLVLTEAGDYTVCAANLCGGLGERSASAEATVATGSLGWATACLPYDAKVPTGTKAYYISATTDDAVTLTELTAIPAGEGFIFNAAEGSHVFPKADTTPDAITNLLEGTLTELTGIASNSIYVLGKNGDNMAAMMLYTGTTLSAGKAYLPASAIPSGARSLRILCGDGITGISQMVNGQCAPDDSVFNLNGQRVEKPLRGLYIRNGKKVIVNNK